MGVCVFLSVYPVLSIISLDGRCQSCWCSGNGLMVPPLPYKKYLLSGNGDLFTLTGRTGRL